MRAEIFIRDQLQAILSPILLLSNESPSVLLVSGVQCEGVPDLSTFISAVRVALDALTQLSSLDGRDWQTYVESICDLGGSLVDLKNSVSGLGNVRQVVEELLGVFVSYYLRSERSVWFHALDLLGVVGVRGSASPDSFYPRPSFFVKLDRVRALFEGPDDYLSELLGLDCATASARSQHLRDFFLPRISRILRSAMVPVAINAAGDVLSIDLHAGAIRGSLLVRIDDESGLVFGVSGGLSVGSTVGRWMISAQLSQERGTFRVETVTSPGSSPLLQLGSQATGFSVAGVFFCLQYVNSSVSVWSVEVGAKELDFRLGADGAADALSAGVQRGGQINARVDLGFRVSSTGSFEVLGSGAAGGRLSLREATVGPVTLQSVVFGIGLGSQGLAISGGIDFRGRLGPVSVSVLGLGVRACGTMTGEGLGGIGFTVGMKPPDGIAIGVDAGPVSGGGTISYSEESGRYIGSLGLRVAAISLAAVGVVDTRLPEMSGYSFLIIISAEFTSVQLGFGFTMNGVGGLCGIQRSVSIPALQAGVRSGGLAPLLFPRDPVGQASQLVTALQTVFPPTQDRYVFGPMFKLGWGTPTLVTADLGVILQLPEPIVVVLIGQLAATFPKPGAAIVELHIDIAGGLDTGERRLWIDAGLRDSRVGPFALTGDMALRLHWGAESDFALSIGGFNPAFKPPPNFPTLRRLALSLGSGSNPRISLSAYFALTSNTLQVGARAEIYAEAAGFNILGYLEFHALFIFSPFHFRFDFAAGVALRRGSTVLAGVSVVGLIEGPGPWHVKGSASITILFFDISVDFETTFGAPSIEAPTETLDPWILLEPALGDVRNWSAPLPEGRSRGVTLAASDRDPAQLRLDPFSRLAVQQKELPLNQRITKLGERHVATPTRFVLGALRLGGSEAAGSGAVIETEALTGAFAAGQFQALTDAEKLSRPSFEPMQAGARVGGAMMAAGVPVPGPIEFRRTFAESRAGTAGSPVGMSSQAMLAAQGFVQASSLAAAELDRFAPSPTSIPLVQLSPETYTLANADTLQVAAGFAATASPSQAAVALQALPSARGQFLVVPSFESRS